MATTDLSDYKNLYLQTAKEYMNKMALSLNQLSDNASNKEALNDLHIASHSLKSQSQVMGYNDIANICLSIEKTSDDILDKIAQIDGKFIIFLKGSIDKINLSLAQIEKGDAETAFNAVK